MSVSREVRKAALRLADQSTDKLREVPALRGFNATVTTVTAGAAGDGNALVKVTYRGNEFRVAAFLNSYTPVLNDRVLVLIVDNQPIVAGREIGWA